ncbi:MAG: hypothetical protein ACE5JP_03325, partial [Candidatus Bipolaricaulia bacterium]
VTRNMRLTVRIGLLVGVLTWLVSNGSFAQMQIPPVEVVPIVPMPDLIVEDIEFFCTGTGELQTLNVRVFAKNVGDKEAGFFLVKLFKTVTGPESVGFAIVFNPVFPVAIGVGPLGIGETQVVEWENVGTCGVWSGYFLAVVDLPTSARPFGRVEEGPTIMAEKNNTLAVPSPVGSQ